MSKQADKAKRQQRVEYLLVIRGLTPPAITAILYEEGLLTSKRRASGERLVRKDVEQILDGLPPAKAAQASPLGLAKYIRRNEALFDRLMAEFETVEGVTLTKMTYPNGGGVMSIERRADRGGLRIRAAELALKCADTLAKVEGVAAMLAKAATEEQPGDGAGTVEQPSLQIVPPDPSRMTPEQRKRLAAQLRSSHPEIAGVYETYTPEPAAAGESETPN